jgi:peptide/nickel transport system ATP-binding protein
MSDGRAPLLSLRGLTVDFTVSGGVLHAVRGIDLDLHRGEVVAVVGESGSGKSTAMLAAMGLLAPNATVGGQALLDGTDLVSLPPAALRAVRGRRVAMIFQDPMTSLNPVLSIGRQLSEALLVHRPMPKRAAHDRARELLELVAIPHAAERLHNYPHELSGGMRQRVMIAMAMANDPDVLIADEPTTALDVTIQAQILEVLSRLRRERDLGVIVVTHDLGVVAGIADTVHVMYAGSVVEHGDVRSVFYAPDHPYTRGLLACSPRLDSADDDLAPIPGSPPVLTELPAGCAFAPRCAHAADRCLTERPMLRRGRATQSACLLIPTTNEQELR